MNLALSRIWETESDPRFMPSVPTAHHNHGNGKCEEVPLVNKSFLMRCGIEALYIVCEQLEADERFSAETKEDLADIIISKTQGQEPDKALLPPPMVPPPKLTVRDKRAMRGAKRQIKEAMREMRHGNN